MNLIMTSNYLISFILMMGIKSRDDEMLRCRRIKVNSKFLNPSAIAHKC